MAILNYNVQADMSTPVFWYGDLGTVDSSTIEILSGSLTGIYSGSFKYSKTGAVSGKLNSYEETYNGVSLGTAQYLNFNAATAFYYIQILGDAQALNELILKGNDTVYGSVYSDTLLGYKGNDTLYGFDGDDLIYGGIGNDTIYGGDDNDYLLGEAGNDLIYAGSGVNLILGGVGNDTIYGGDIMDTLSGDAGNDLIYAGSGENSIDGGVGNDTIYGGDGNDDLLGGAGNDLIYAGSGANYIYGGDGNDKIYGEDGENWLIGGNGNDTIIGGSLGNYLVGGLGKDTITGGSNPDLFIFSYAASSSNKDTILDFQVEADGIFLDPVVFTSLTDLHEENFINGPKALDGNDYLIFTKNTLYYDDDGYGSNKMQAIAYFPGVTSLDFDNLTTVWI
ncbi:RTX calcium-binding nonapeptide repeat [Candidatus Methylopumilus planktonicus]|uniref:calcium-binding protein n=1 Tax=Candidatus Methylopumilus planktonicus TaxID=1581557 RepID=UPI003BEF3A2F